MLETAPRPLDRRRSPRMPLRRGCKLYEPRSRRYFAGTTADVSQGGMRIDLDRELDLEPGDRLFIGVDAPRRGLVRHDSLVEARVIRVDASIPGMTIVAVSLREAPEALHPTLALAA